MAKRYVCSINNNIESLKANDFNIDDVVIRYPKNNEFMSKRAFILANKI